MPNCSMRADGQRERERDTTKVTFVFHYFANARKKNRSLSFVFPLIHSTLGHVFSLIPSAHIYHLLLQDFHFGVQPI